MHFRALALHPVSSYLPPAAFSITQKQFGAFLLMGGSSALLLQSDSWPSSKGASFGRPGSFIHTRGAPKTAGPLQKRFSHLKRTTFPVETRHVSSLLLRFCDPHSFNNQAVWVHFTYCKSDRLIPVKHSHWRRKYSFWVFSAFDYSTAQTSSFSVYIKVCLSCIKNDFKNYCIFIKAFATKLDRK